MGMFLIIFVLFLQKKASHTNHNSSNNNNNNNDNKNMVLPQSPKSNFHSQLQFLMEGQTQQCFSVRKSCFYALPLFHFNFPQAFIGGTPAAITKQTLTFQ